ncbi:LamB/YcsF family protein [Rufibacter radiotolerans]|uniref:5-oxoprolinase subunit A n=1 Tax=Rufibacter radiotolerans TaxID=1379910 RepID=A0A0H4VHJ9_9BACT|nr:5-oxoprolinase subunit PxpA [Rufibacter radiotolerans]AKQ45170.1 LamB/YcsF family protein [Rufibacter radiotolerans]
MNEHTTVDLNCDLGESFGAYQLGHDEAILPYVTSANIACGFHAGDPSVMKKTVRLALAQNVAIGAHPGFPDLVGFGRRDMAVSPEEVYDMVVYQIGALTAFVQAEGSQLHHVKPHGALYNMAAVNPGLAEAIAEAIYKVQPSSILYGLAGSELIHAGQRIGLRVAQEVFADRTYQANGTLTPRRFPNALITDQQTAVNQVLRMVKEGKVQTLYGKDITIQADTICLHGDGAHALEFARSLHQTLTQERITLKAMDII